MTHFMRSITTVGSHITVSGAGWPVRWRKNRTVSPASTAMSSSRYETSLEKTGGISAQPLMGHICRSLCRIQARTGRPFSELGSFRMDPEMVSTPLAGATKVLETSDCAPGCIQMRPILAHPDPTHLPSYPPLFHLSRRNLPLSTASSYFHWLAP